MKRWNRVATDWKHILEVNNAAGSSLSFSGIFPHDGGFFRRLVEETFRSIKYFIAGEQFHSDLRSPLNIFPIINVFREKSAEEIPGPVANIIKYYHILKPDGGNLQRWLRWLLLQDYPTVTITTYICFANSMLTKHLFGKPRGKGTCFRTLRSTKIENGNMEKRKKPGIWTHNPRSLNSSTITTVLQPLQLCTTYKKMSGPVTSVLEEQRPSSQAL